MASFSGNKLFLNNNFSTSSGGAAVLWTPANITTELWLDADDAATIADISGAVSQWDDKSGNNRDVAQATEADKPTTGTRTIGGLNVLDFDGDVLENSGIGLLGNPDIIIAALLVYDTNISNVDRSVQIDTDAGESIAMTGGSNDLSVRYADGFTEFSATPLTSNIIQVVQKIAGETYGEVQMFIDGTEDTILETANPTFTIDLQDINFMVGEGAGADPIDGAIGEVVIVNASDTTTRQLLEGYLAWKWGLEGSLPIGHPYKNAAPTV